MTTKADELIDEGTTALRGGDAEAARRAFQAAAELAPTGAALEGLGGCAYLELDFTRCIADWEQAYAAYRAKGDPVGSARLARKIGFMYGAIVGDAAVMSGWLTRAKTLLEDADESSERGWVALTRGMFEEDRETRNRCFTEALDVARAFGDADLEFSGLAYLGASLVHEDRNEEGMLLLDEALAAVAPSSGSASATTSRHGATCPPCRPSAARITAAS
jgi:tetratricopeptide (TPR) repeat protein